MNADNTQPLTPATWLAKSLEDLEGDRWGEPKFGSALVHDCHESRRIPLGQLEAWRVDILLGQQIGAEFLLPLALDMLEREPLLEARFHQGDLLVTVCRELAREMACSRSVADRARAMLEALPPLPTDLEEGARREVETEVARARARFSNGATNPK